MSDFYACLLERETQVQILSLTPGLFAEHIIFTNVCSIHMRNGKYNQMHINISQTRGDTLMCIAKITQTYIFSPENDYYYLCKSVSACFQDILANIQIGLGSLDSTQGRGVVFDPCKPDTIERHPNPLAILVMRVSHACTVERRSSYYCERVYIKILQLFFSIWNETNIYILKVEKIRTASKAFTLGSKVKKLLTFFTILLVQKRHVFIFKHQGLIMLKGTVPARLDRPQSRIYLTIFQKYLTSSLSFKWR